MIPDFKHIDPENFVRSAQCIESDKNGGSTRSQLQITNRNETAHFIPGPKVSSAVRHVQAKLILNTVIASGAGILDQDNKFEEISAESGRR